MAAGEFLCAQCARLGKTCCQGREIYVTPGDVQRIFWNTGNMDFYEFIMPADPDYADQADDPIWRNHVFLADGRRRVLKRSSSDDCIFLGKTGCVLSMGVRPLVCRLHPYTYTAAGLSSTPETGCPVNLLNVGESLMDVLSMPSNLAGAWWHDLYEEILHDGNGAETLMRT